MTGADWDGQRAISPETYSIAFAVAKNIAWASLTNPPLTATNVKWTIEGGNGAIQCSNGKQMI